jgi:hypothetical protein
MADIRQVLLLVVPSDWIAEMAVGLSEDTYQRYFDHLQSGMRVLIYKPAPVDAIVAEGEVIDHLMLRLSDWPHVSIRERPRTGLGKPADYVLPLRMLYSRPSFNYIGLPTIQEWIDDPDFPNVECLLINQDAYAELSNWP